MQNINHLISHGNSEPCHAAPVGLQPYINVTAPTVFTSTSRRYLDKAGWPRRVPCRHRRGGEERERESESGGNERKRVGERERWRLGFSEWEINWGMRGRQYERRGQQRCIYCVNEGRGGAAIEYGLRKASLSSPVEGGGSVVLCSHEEINMRLCDTYSELKTDSDTDYQPPASQK